MQRVGALLDLLLKEQFVTTYWTVLGLFLRERIHKDINLKEIVELTEHYLEAHSGSISGKCNTISSKPKSPKVRKLQMRKVGLQELK